MKNKEYPETKYPHSEITDKIIKCAIEVHKTLGPGFLENIYEKALLYELNQAGLKAREQVSIPIDYKGTNIGEHRLDLLVADEVIVENKTVSEFDDIHMAQVLSYLKATGKQIGLLLNFAKTKVEIKRVIR
jgi:GxxExxY protein